MHTSASKCLVVELISSGLRYDRHVSVHIIESIIYTQVLERLKNLYTLQNSRVSAYQGYNVQL